MEGRWWCFDATRSLNQFGRYMNHTPGSMVNATPVPPVLLEGRLRVGFIATKHIQAGEEITWDYGVRGEPWLPDKVTPVLTLIPIKHVIYMRSHPATHLVSISDQQPSSLPSRIHPPAHPHPRPRNPFYI